MPVLTQIPHLQIVRTDCVEECYAVASHAAKVPRHVKCTRPCWNVTFPPAPIRQNSRKNSRKPGIFGLLRTL